MSTNVYDDTTDFEVCGFAKNKAKYLQKKHAKNHFTCIKEYNMGKIFSSEGNI